MVVPSVGLSARDKINCVIYIATVWRYNGFASLSERYISGRLTFVGFVWDIKLSIECNIFF